MKAKIFLVITLSLFFTRSLLAQEYTTKMEVIFTSEHKSVNLQHVKAAIDSKEHLHVVFTEFENHFFYGTNQSGSWKFKQLQYFDTQEQETFDVVKLTNIAVDANDNVHIVTFDRYGEKVVYGKKPASSGEFKLQTVKLSPEPRYLSVYGGYGEEYSDLAVDKNGGLHLICKADYRTQDETKYSQCATYFHKPVSSDNWNLEVLIYDPQFDDRNWSYGTSSSIACYDDKVYAVIGGANELHFGTGNISGGKWDIERLLYTPDKAINSGKDETSLAISPNGSIKLAFLDRTDADDESDRHGVNIFSRSNCGDNQWKGFNFSKSLPVSATTVYSPEVAFDNNGKFYIAFGRNEYALWHQTCDCNAEYKKIYSFEAHRADQVAMVIGSDNTVYTFFTSNYDNQLRFLTAKPQSSTKNCNYPPKIVNHTGKTNLKPGETWTATITASDPECDKIKFETIIQNDIFNFKDNGDGTATITATMPEGEGKGTPGISVWALDEKHPDTNDEVSVITFQLVITPEGEEKGSIKVTNKCSGNNDGMPISNKKKKSNKEASPSQSSTTTTSTSSTKASSNAGGNGQINSSAGRSNPDCEKFLADYEAYSQKYIPVASKVKANPMDVNSAMQLGTLMEEYAALSTQWVNLSECHDNPVYQKRYDEITKKIQDANP